MIAGDPRQGGATWAVLQYLLGLRELGHDAFLVEPVRESSLRPAGAALAESENAAYFRRTVAELGLERCAAILLSGTRETVGLPYEELHDQCHVLIAPILRELDILRAGDEEMVAGGATRRFLPHGLPRGQRGPVTLPPRAPRAVHSASCWR